jgi:hypothetical protein
MLVTGIEGRAFVAATLGVAIHNCCAAKSRIAAVQSLVDERAFCGGEGFVFAGEVQERMGFFDAALAVTEQFVVYTEQQFCLFGNRHRKRVNFDGE